MPPRAAPLPPDDRRAAILAAVAPVVLERGPAATTRQLAAAACVAEGTLFRVFSGKDELVTEAAKAILHSDAHLDRFAAIDPALPLPERLGEIAAVWQEVAGSFLRVVVAFSAERHRLGDPRDLIDQQAAREAERIIAGLIAPDAARFRMPVAEVVEILRGLVMMSVHPRDIGPPMSAERVVDLLLHGVTVRGRVRPGPGENPLTPPPGEAAGWPADAAYLSR